MKLVSPVLPDMLPLYKVVRPPDPVVMVGEPLKIILPPVDVPAAVLWPALRITALELVLLVVIF